jgi:hypothetical protein
MTRSSRDHGETDSKADMAVAALESGLENPNEGETGEGGTKSPSSEEAEGSTKRHETLPTLTELDAEYEARVGARGIVRRLALKFSLAHIVEEAISVECSLSEIKLLSCGMFNKVYILCFTDGSEVVASSLCRIQRRTPKSVDTGSTAVASMKYAKRNLKPEFACLVPEVYGWNASPDNPVCQPYIIMQKMSGSTLASCQ